MASTTRDQELLDAWIDEAFKSVYPTGVTTNEEQGIQDDHKIIEACLLVVQRVITDQALSLSPEEIAQEFRSHAQIRGFPRYRSMTRRIYDELMKNKPVPIHSPATLTPLVPLPNAALLFKETFTPISLAPRPMTERGPREILSKKPGQCMYPGCDSRPRGGVAYCSIHRRKGVAATPRG